MSKKQRFSIINIAIKPVLRLKMSKAACGKYRQRRVVRILVRRTLIRYMESDTASTSRYTLLLTVRITCNMRESWVIAVE